MKLFALATLVHTVHAATEGCEQTVCEDGPREFCEWRFVSLLS
jgi:hypothetical protein